MTGPLSALERLLAEEWPDGTFGGPLRRYTPRHDPAAAQHQADLAAALDGTEWQQDIPNPNRKAHR